MSPDLERLIGRAVMDKAFRDSLLADPEGTVKKAGLQLLPQEMEQLKADVKGTTSQQLDQQLASLQSHW